ncbi:MAG: LysR family transcriptional regulator [Acidobacteriota bacterium]
MDLNQIKYFLGLADELHFWRASEKMFITQSALSRHIQAIEQELGIQLFERNKRNVKLTQAGEFLRGEYRRILSEMESINRHAMLIQTGEVGSLRIGHPGSITYSILPDLLTGFGEKYSHIKIELTELLTENVEIALLNYHIDIGFNRESVTSKGLQIKKIMTEPFALVVPITHPLSKKSISDLTDLTDAKEEKFILPSITSEIPHAKSLRQIFNEYNFTPQIQYQSEFGSTILALVGRGLGVSILPFSYSAHSSRRVRFIKLPHMTTLYMVWRKDDSNSVLKNFIRIVEIFSGSFQK